MKTSLIIQARMGSSRLPGKVLKEIKGKPMLEWVISRGSLAGKVDETVVATTGDPGDDAIAAWCSQRGIPCFRGAPFDVLDRFYQTALWRKAERIVRVTADCPLIDPHVIDETITLFETSGADFTANRLPPPWHRTFPIGLDVEVVSFAMLERAWKEAAQPSEREHVMPWFYNTEGRCKIRILDHEPDCGMHRWTVDTPDDYALLQEIFSRLDDPLHASWLDVLDLIQQHPELEQINESTHAKRVDVVDERLRKGGL